MNTTVAIKSVECLHDQSSTFWSYVIVLADGRRWEQTLHSVSGEPEMTFTVTDKWKMSEFSLHRTIQDELIRLIRDYALVNFRIKYAPA